MRVTILGAPASGKTWLARELALRRPDLRISEGPSPEPPRPDDLTLLMGLDLPCPASAEAHQREREPFDAALRRQLQQSGTAYGVVYGQGAQRLRNALRLIAPEAAPASNWVWACEKCSDPDCEHRLFSALRGLRAADRPPS